MFSPCGRYLVDGTWSGDLVVRDASSGEVVWQDHVANTAIRYIAATPDRQRWVVDRAGTLNRATGICDESALEIYRWVSGGEVAARLEGQACDR